MKKIISLILIIASLLLLVSCGQKNRKYNEEEVKAAAIPLIRKSAELNDIFWGKGIPYFEDPSFRVGNFYPADPSFVRELGIEKTEDLIKLASKVFSQDYVEFIKNSVLSSKVGNNGMDGYARYYDEPDIMLMVDTKYEPILVDEVEYLYDSIEVIGSEGETVKIKITINVTRGEASQTRELTVSLVEEEEGWRLNSNTYANFRPGEPCKQKVTKS